MWKTKVLTRHLAWWEKWVKACIVKDRLYIQKEIYLCTCTCRLKNKKKLYCIISIKKLIRYTKSFDVEKSKKFEKICKVHVYVLY